MNLLNMFKANIPTAGTVSASYTATADGTTTGTIAAGINVAYVAGANSSNKVILPAPVKGVQLIVINQVAAQTLTVIGNGNTITINGVTGSPASITLAAASSLFCIAISATEWIVEQIATPIA